MPDEIQVPIKYTVDRQSVQQTVRESGRVEEALEDIQDSAEQTQRAVTKAEAAERKAVEATARAMEAKSKADRTSKSLTDRAGGLERPLRDIQGLAGGMGGSLVPDLLGAIDGFGQLKEQFPQLKAQAIAAAGGAGKLTASLGLAGAALLALEIIQKQYKKALEDSQEPVKAYMQTVREVADVIANGTTKQAEAMVENEQAQIRAAQYERDRLQAFLAAQENTDGFAGALLDLNDSLGLDLGSVEDVQNRVKELNGTIDSSEGVIDTLNQGMEEGAFAAADMKAAEEELAKAREQTSNAIIELEKEKAKEQVEEAQRTRDWSAEQVKSRLAAIETERAAQESYQTELDKRLESGVLTQDEHTKAMNESQDAVRALAREELSLKDVVTPLVALREREVEVTKEVASNLDQANKNAAKRRELQEEYDAETLSVAAERRTKEIQEQEDHARKVVKETADFYASLTDYDKQYYSKRDEMLAQQSEVADEEQKAQVKELREYNKASIRLAEDQAAKLLDIQKKRDRDIRKAAARLDATQVLDIQESAEDELKAQDDQYNKEQKRRAEEFQDRLRDLEAERNTKLQAGRQALADLQTQYQQERQAKINAFYAKLSEDDQERQITLQRQRQAWASEDIERLNHFNAALTATRTGYANILAETNVYMLQMKQAVAATMKQMAAGAQVPTSAIQYRAATGNTGAMSSYGGYRAPDIYGAGGNAAAGSLGLVGDKGPEWVYFGDNAHVFPSGTNPTINLSMPISVAGGAATPLTDLKSQVALEKRLSGVVRREIQAFFEETA